MNELYKKYRPRSFKGVVGQKGPIASLSKMVENGKIPHAILFTGPSGCGKTTLARILKTQLNCGERDFIEINCSDFRGIDMVRDIRKHAALSPLEGDCRVWLIDECHKMSNDAQNAFLKILEDTPSHVYFMLATTEPQKLLKTIHTRCTEIKLRDMTVSELSLLISRVVKKESMTVSEDVISEIAEAAEGSARKALVILEQVGYLPEEDQLEAVSASSAAKDEAILIARALLNPSIKWPEIAKLIKECKEEPESVRWLVLGYCTTVMLGGGKLAPRAFVIIDVFSSPFYDSKKAGLAAACWEVVNGA